MERACTNPAPTRIPTPRDSARPGPGWAERLDRGGRYVVITSSGRSGSNRLLDVLDQQPTTNCRSETTATWAGFLGLPRPIEVADLPADFPSTFGARIAETRLRRGERDHHLMMAHKSYLRGGVGAAWMRAMGSARVRGRIRRGAARTDWPIPKAALGPEAAGHVAAVFKMGAEPAWLGATHPAHEGQILIHNIRDPRDYLASWYNRFVRAKGQDLGDLYRRVVRLSVPALASYGRPPRPLRYDLHALLVYELLHWRHANERLMAHHGASPRYLRVTYEETSLDRMAVAERIYAHAGLALDGAMRDRIAGLENTIFARPHAERLDAGAVEAAVREALPDGPIAALYR